MRYYQYGFLYNWVPLSFELYSLKTILSTVFIIATIIGLWKFFEKMGYKGWEGLIPVYNLVVALDQAEIHRAYVFLFFIPIIQIAMLIYLGINLSKKFGKNELWGILIIILPVWLLILGLSKDIKFNGAPMNHGTYNKKVDNINVNDNTTNNK